MVRLTMLASVLGTTITPYISIPNPQLSGGPPPRLRIQLGISDSIDRIYSKNRNR